ncbi:hypothetical protein DL768_007613 [Monosporascus sp. mg162]|nr:hypothetical protein DL768_007613 [Monosporascus sp. mg162]
MSQPERTPRNNKKALRMAKLAVEAQAEIRARGRGDGGREAGTLKHSISDRRATQQPTPSHECGASSRVKKQDSADDHEIPAKLGEDKTPERRVADQEPAREGREAVQLEQHWVPKETSLKLSGVGGDIMTDTEEATTIEFSPDTLCIKTRPAEVRGLAVVNITAQDADVYETGYSNCRLAKEVEREITSAIATAPALDVEQWVAAHFMLVRAGQIGGVVASHRMLELVKQGCADVFRKFFTKNAEKKAIESSETCSSRQPILFPDMRRRSLRWIDWLVKNSKLNFRRPEKEPRLAKSGVYHFSTRCRSGRPRGKHGIRLSKDSARQLHEDDALDIRLMPKLD